MFLISEEDMGRLWILHFYRRESDGPMKAFFYKAGKPTWEKAL